MREKKLFHILMHIGKLLEQAIRNQLEPLELHHGQARTLSVLSEKGTLTQTSLARGMGITQKLLTKKMEF
ncbi:MAG: hypothetical protein HQL32_07905 [Planctomycetes bacterium]|nr:hypothetical protein [Planctomycetota bacterium]